MAKHTPPSASASAERKIEGFAEDLGRLLGQAQNRAESWIGQRKQIVGYLEGIRQTATKLLNQLGHDAAGTTTKTGRGAKRTAKDGSHKSAAKVKRATRILSDEARAAIAAAQKKRWAKWRKAQKPQ